MKFTIFDLEHQDYKVIQIGAIAASYSPKDGMTILETLSLDVKWDDLVISDYICELTGIDQDRHDAGVPFEKAATALRKLHTDNSCFPNPIVWGQGDVKLLETNGMNVRCFGRRIIDVKTMFVGYQIARDEPFTGGLIKSMKRIGAPLYDPDNAHDAYVDAYNTMNMFAHLSSKMNGSK